MFRNNILDLIFWLCILVYFIWDIKNSYIRFSKNRKYIIYMNIISFIHIIIYFYIGFIFGFSKSPYNHELLTGLKNVVMKIFPILSIELIRSVIATRNKDNKIKLVTLIIFLILLEINYNTLINLYSNKKELFEYICANVLPIISCNMLYTYLTLKGSYTLVLVYRLYKEIVPLLLPILPDINWFISGTVGILSPTIVYLLFQYYFTKQTKDRIKKQKNLSEKIIYGITIIFLITLICFMLGLFKYEPITILSNSMAPSFNRGDIVIYKKLNNSELKQISENSIIIYSIGEQNIAHRVVDRTKENNTVLYQTKGDSNNVADTNLVQIDQIKGVYTLHIKYIGFPSVWLYDYFNKEDAKVETK